MKQWGPEGATFEIKPDDSSTTQVVHGPYKRKGELHSGYTTRGCVCSSRLSKLVCPHLWASAFREQGINSAERMSANEFTSKLQHCAHETLGPEALSYVRDWTPHVFRRGSAIDILQASGVAAMMQHGEWGSEAAAHAYASIYEIETEKLRAACASMPDLSDDE